MKAQTQSLSYTDRERIRILNLLAADSISVRVARDGQLSWEETYGPVIRRTLRILGLKLEYVIVSGRWPRKVDIDFWRNGS